MITAIQAQAALLESLSAQIRAAGTEDDYCSITIQPGNAVVFDFGPESDCKGTAWVRLVGTSPSLSVGKNGCAQWLNYVIEVGMVAPTPVLENSMGEFILPTDEEMFDAAARQANEMQLMFTAIQTADLDEVSLGEYQPQGPDGGVLGGLWTVTVAAE